MKCERSFKRVLVRHIQISRVNRMSMSEAIESTKNYMRKPIEEIKELLKIERAEHRWSVSYT